MHLKKCYPNKQFRIPLKKKSVQEGYNFKLSYTMFQLTSFNTSFQKKNIFKTSQENTIWTFSANTLLNIV